MELDNFDDYAYSDILHFFNERYDNKTEKTNYAQLLLSMNTCDKISSCTKIYKKVYTKYLKIINSTSQAGHKSFDEDLNECLNENLIRIMGQDSSLNTNKAFKYLANLRQSANIDKFQHNWKDIIKSKRIQFEQFEMHRIINAQRRYEKAREEYLHDKHKQEIYEYERICKNIKESLNLLKSHKYIILPYDVNIGTYINKTVLNVGGWFGNHHSRGNYIRNRVNHSFCTHRLLRFCLNF